ncbi:GRIM-19 protein-domain-containing protein [Fimicolochytrium jonesii]|uniref:GRIM-19 protein-domain-containing protein n=1 Tax=Fimicolochytrium jonesii TaxID=1396493 RepID=UPI0022FF0BEC|nr:GRIM-19 protein-domain-containing protein [Fimicolochytrium jonesii]KAI8823559.1 GRIM-19 protein-domain-containing protein [Fimicolochytrium jonesii]
MSGAAQYKQDMPPPGGFPETIQYKRYLPRRGPSGVVMFIATFGIMGYGWYWVAQANAERRELRREKAWNRIALVPLLQAETDRDLVRRLEAAKDREGKMMENVKGGWSALDLKTETPGVGKSGARDYTQSEPVYHTERHVNPTFLFLPWSSDARIDSQWWRGSKMFLKNPAYHDRPDFTKEHPIGGQ